MRANVSLRAVAVAAGLAALMGTAQAADVVYEEPPAPAPAPMMSPVVTWEGAYLGLYSGYGFGGRTTGAAGGPISTNGWLFGGFGGYNFQNGAFVYGLEGDLGYSGINGGNGTTYSRNGLEGSLRARLGYAVTDDILLYTTAGGAGTRQRIYDAAGTDAGNTFGWTVGAGIDAKVTDNMFGRVEYRYTDFGNTTLNTGSGPQTVSSSNNRVTVGLGVKF